MRLVILAFSIMSLLAWTAQGVDLAVVSTSPDSNTAAAPSATIIVDFDRALDNSSIDESSFRVFGSCTGTATGTVSFGNGNARIVFVPSFSFSAGETVMVNLAESVRGFDGSNLRIGGYAFAFGIRTRPANRLFRVLDVMSNRNGGQTRIYGAMAGDLDGDRFIDLATVNEVSADIRVFMNSGDGTGRFDDFLTPEPIGFEASPNAGADFDNDGHLDMCVAASSSGSVWILLGDGDGTFRSSQSINVGSEPHGIVTLDIDGDGDYDIVNAAVGSNNLAILLNNGAGVFGAPSYFESGLDGEYGLAAGDMNRDGLIDIVIGSRNDQQLITMLSNGDGTFSSIGSPQDSGGYTWVVTLGDIDGDGDLDASAANSFSFNGAIIRNRGDGTFDPPETVFVGAHTVSCDLGDLDGDGDLDWVISSFGGGFWRVYLNDGTGSFSFDQEFTAPNNPSCSVLFDIDRDGDLDIVLTDEIADVAIILENEVIQASSRPTRAR